ncbi:MAG: DUF1206 domain-containing protein, partial [Candidatus Binatia bacterium]
MTLGAPGAASSSRTPRVLVALGRVGLAARGLVYITTGLFAAMAGLGLGRGKIVDKREAIGALGNSALGTSVLWAVGVGLASYVLWRFSQIIFGGRDVGDGWKRVRKRIVAAGSGLAYMGLAATAFTKA